MKHYSEEFKEGMLKKVCNSSKSIPELAKETGIPISTLYLWRRKKKAQPMNSPSSKLSLEQKFQIVLETSNLGPSELTAYLREKGLYSHQLKTFKDEISQSLNQTTKKGRPRNPRKKENKLLKKELLRKEKALAEASALLLLKKKLDLFYPEEKDENSL